MSSKFAGVTFDDQAATPSDDAIIRRAILADGILTGCEVSYTGSTLTMTAGQLMICGRQVKHPSTQNWAVADATTGFARLVLTIDLTRTSSKDTFEQVVDTVEYASAVDGFADLVQEDINASGTKYQIVAAVVSMTTGGISGIVSQLGQTSTVMGEKSVIIVDNLPTGSTVTCTKGTVTKTAAERNGEWWFKGLEIGTWTLRAEKDGEQPVTQKFEITEFGVYRVKMSYFKSTIKVTYPAGSTCTCSKSGKTFTAPNTSGSYTFTVDSAGTWVVKATDGSRSKSVSVVISASGESKSAVLNYALVLYDHGVIEMAVSGGLVANQGGGLIRFDSDNIYFANRTDSNNNESLRSQNLMDLSEYTRLCTEVTYIYGSSLTMSVLNEANSAVCKISIPSNNDNTVRVLDISAVSVPCRFAFSSSLSSCRIYKIWFE